VHVHADKSEYLNGIISKIPHRNSKILGISRKTGRQN
jgi:hypothetical protein